MTLKKKSNKLGAAIHPAVIGVSIILPLGSLIPLSIMAWKYYKSTKKDK